MDTKLVYVKTPIGDEAVRQSTRVVQRNLRMVLVQVDGKLSIAELGAKIGNVGLVEGALQELEKGGFIAPTSESISTWAESDQRVESDQFAVLSQFSTFGPKSLSPSDTADASRAGKNFSSFGKPVFPAAHSIALEPPQFQPKHETEIRFDGHKPGVSILKWTGIGLMLMLSLLFGLAAFYPYASLKPAIEASASRYLLTQVRIGDVGVTFSPWPQLKLSDIKVGESADSRIEEVRIASPLALLGSGPHRISLVEVFGADFLANRVVALPMFSLPPGSAASNISLQEIRFSQMQITIRDLALRDLTGEIRFRPDGSIEKASFQAVDRSIQFSAAPTAHGIALSIEGLGWRPAGVLLSFDSLQARGVLKKDRLLIESLDTTFLGGILKGTWLFDWSNGLVIGGDASLSRLDCRKVSAAFAPLLKLEGDLGGTLRLRAGGSDWENMWQNVEVTLNAEVTRGILHGVDLGEAARRGVGSVARSGATKFDRLHTTMTINPRQLSGQDVQMNAGMMTASGQFVAKREGQVDGELIVGIQTSASTLRVPVRVSGVLPDLVVVGK